MEHPIKMDDLGENPLFLETPNIVVWQKRQNMMLALFAFFVVST